MLTKDLSECRAQMGNLFESGN